MIPQASRLGWVRQNRAFRPRCHFAFSRNLLAAVFSLSICTVGHAAFTNVVYDGFNYSAGSLAGQNGGSGWTSAWAHLYGSGSSLQVSASGMSYTGLTSSGGSAVWGSGGNGISEATRNLPLVDSGIVYVEFLSQFGSTSGGGTPNLRLFHSGALTGGLGGNGGTYGARMSILDNNLNAASDGSSSSLANLSSLNYVVVRIDYQNNDTEMWVNPNLSTFDYENPTTPNASYAGLAPAFDSLAFYTRNPASLDEFRVMAEPVPEPAPVLLVVIGLGILLFGWRVRGRL